jgi:hypothetical protein
MQSVDREMILFMERDHASKPLFKKIDCIRLYVSDLDEAIAFYQGRLGHRLIWRSMEAAGLKMRLMRE